ncbi:Glyoxalase/Bleomycin resistance protein/Dihydroxybiphenyl dioxygenase [Ephemerocybe angulata]|uniref:Glyoxalase/Bleomycin resistance protein/Dihydroxybiphenyl dioxygenase n=1 Tax=Ephemerocybe angulata TaxID=980116 RepID=A0A8H6I545_9AGAR|nr:Glyoxalase/Bleomycin resistance protein/Dihydroxybiphenyl dioxygenase [Tulosesus angulatus]
MPLDHIALHTKDIVKLSAFYEAALKPLGYEERHSVVEGAVRGYGTPGHPADLWISAFPGKVPAGFEELPVGAWGGPIHIAFKAETKEQVHAFHEAAIVNGGQCNGPPGPRTQTFVTEYAAFVHDPDGRNIEVNYVTPK